MKAGDLCARAATAGTVDVVFSRRRRPHTPSEDLPGEVLRAPTALRYDTAADLAVLMLGTDDLSEACPLDSADICVLWDNGRVVGIAVSNASTHLAPEMISDCEAFNTLSLGRFEQDL